MAAEFEKKHFVYNKWTEKSFSALVSVKGPGTMLYLAGIGAEDEDDPAGGVLHVGDVYAQSRLAFEKARDLLAKHGATMKDIVKITAYLTDIRERPHYQRARKEALADVADWPAHTLLVVSALARPGMEMEIDIVAAVSA